MSFELWIAFVVASSILLVIPGPTILTVTSYSLTHGKRASMPLIAAVALGDSTALFLSLAGLGVVLSTSVWGFTVLKWVGGLYLIYLGLTLLAQKSTLPVDENTHGDDSNLTLFLNTWLVTSLNPKGIIFFVAFLPQFIDQYSSLLPQLWILSTTFVILATLNAALYVYFARKIRRLLASPMMQRRFNLCGGGLITAAGIWALSADKPV